MEEQNKNNREEIFSKRIRAGKKRTYFIDVRATRNDDFYLTITESKRKFGSPNKYIKHKIFLYKEDFNKFVDGLQEAVDYVKTELLPDYDFEKFDKNGEDDNQFDSFDSSDDQNNGEDDDEFSIDIDAEIPTPNTNIDINFETEEEETENKEKG